MGSVGQALRGWFGYALAAIASLVPTVRALVATPERNMRNTGPVRRLTGATPGEWK